MNIDSVEQDKGLTEFVEETIEADAVNKDGRNSQIADLQAEISDMKKIHSEERYMWILVSVIVFDTLAFRRFDNWGSPLVIGFLELIGLIGYAEKCGVGYVREVVNWLANGWGQNSGSK